MIKMLVLHTNKLSPLQANTYTVQDASIPSPMLHLCAYAHGGQKRALYTLERELQAVGRCHMESRHWTPVLWKSLNTELSFQPQEHWAIFPAPRPRFLQWITLLHKILCGQSIGREWEHLINLIPDLFMAVWIEGHWMCDRWWPKVSSHAGLSMHQDPNESHCSKRPQRSCGQGPPCSHSCSGEMGITTLCPKDSAPWHLPLVHRIYAYMGYHCIDAGVIYVTVYEYIYKENVSEHTLLLTKCYQNSLATKQLAKRKGKKNLTTPSHSDQFTNKSQKYFFNKYISVGNNALLCMLVYSVLNLKTIYNCLIEVEWVNDLEVI